jgi:prephenate dehydrogenase
VGVNEPNAAPRPRAAGSAAFGNIIVVGVGLIGGSIALAARALDPKPQVFGVDTDAGTLAYALEHGVLDEAALPDDAVERGWFDRGGADLIVLATPARAAEEWLATIGARGFDGVVTDVASTKSGMMTAATASLGPDAAFVGGHPMAGSERSGVQAATADLFRGAYYVLTPTSSTDISAYQRVHSFVSSLGARAVSVDAETHDEAVAIVSHVPHVTAAALVDLAKAHAGPGDELLRLAAGGFKDTTRIAAGSADLWTGICLDNADALTRGIDELCDRLADFGGLVRSRDAGAVRAWLEQAASVRRSLPAKWVPSTEQLTELFVPILDRPGVVSEVTTAVSHAGCNIESIEIDHQSEDSAVLVLVLTDEGDTPGLLADLEARGYRPRLQPLDDAPAKGV